MRTEREADAINNRIKEAGWFHGTEADWHALDFPTKERLAFEGCGCAVAFPTWEGPVDCVHVTCQILRGELPKIAEMNMTLRYEAESGWLRDVPRARLAAIFRAYRRAARASGIYNPWRLDWRLLVWSGVTS
jgi:hypothetical protein